MSYKTDDTWTDEYGVVYSADKSILLKLCAKNEQYEILEDCTTISNSIINVENCIYTNICTVEKFLEEQEDIIIDVSKRTIYTKSGMVLLGKDASFWINQFKDLPCFKNNSKSLLVATFPNNEKIYHYHIAFVKHCEYTEGSILDTSSCAPKGLQVLYIPNSVTHIYKDVIPFLKQLPVIEVTLPLNSYLKETFKDFQNIKQKGSSYLIHYTYDSIDRYKELFEWNDFVKHFGITNDVILRDLRRILNIKTDEEYPIIIYPSEMSQLYVSFDKDTFDDIVAIGKTLGITSNTPIRPIEPRKPYRKIVEDRHTIEYTHIKWTQSILCFVGLIILLVFLAICASGKPDLSDAIPMFIFLLILYIPFIWMLISGITKTDKRTKEVYYTKREKEKLQADYDAQYEDAVYDYQQRLDRYNNILMPQYYRDCNIYNGYLDDINGKMPKISKYRISKYCRAKSSKYTAIINPPQRGRSENLLFEALMKEFSTYVKVDRKVGTYYPDLILDVNGCCIDIEIDEPYVANTKEETHYISGGDENRNNYFSENNWYVIRFTENQIKYELHICVYIIKKFVKFIETGDTIHLSPIWGLQQQIKEKRWTKEQARLLAIQNARDRDYTKDIRENLLYISNENL